MEPRRAVLIGNLRSRSTAKLFSAAHRLLIARGIEIVESHAVKNGADLRKRVAGAIADGHELVIVGGGDGSMTSVVGHFAHKDAVLGVLPLGTGNSFARSLGIAPTVESAVDAIVHGKVARVDLGLVNGRHFANFATVGLSSRIARATPDTLKKWLGPLAYVVAGIGPLLRSKAFRASIAWEHNKVKVRTHQLIVANGRYYGKTPVLPNATLTDGMLALFTTTGLSRWDVAKLFIAVARNRQTSLANAEYFSAPEISVKTKPDQPLDIDGEAFGATPARFSVDKRALRVMVPAGFDGLT